MAFAGPQARRLALVNGVARSALGVVALIAPGLPLAPWVGPAASDPSARLLARGLGGRDLALGLGTLWALRRAEPLTGWVVASGLADAGDVMATVGRFTALPRLGRWAVLAAAAGGVGAAVLTVVALDE
jgi:peptide-methionine (R)-S-oxide reductase